MRLLICTLVASLALVVPGCGGSASIEKTWKAPGSTPGELHNVVTLFPTIDGALRRTVEDKLAQRLVARGMRAVPAYTVLSDEDIQDRNRAAEKLRLAGFDGVVAIRVVEAHQTLAFYPSFDLYWDGAWSEPMPQTVVRTEIDAYALSDRRLVWSALSKSVDPGGVNQLVDDVSKVVSRQLSKDQVIATR